MNSLTPPLSPSAFSPTMDIYRSVSASPSTSSSSPSQHTTSDNDSLPGYGLSYASSSPASASATASTSAADSESALELRRQRNRESMRRTRQRDKETLTALRSTLTRLETQYARLMAPWNGPADDSLDGVHRRAFLENLQAKLQQLVQLRRSLEAENVAVQRVIQEKQALEAEFQTLLDENALDEMVNEKLALLEASNRTKASDLDYFTPLTSLRAHALISGFCEELDRVKAVAASAPPSPQRGNPNFQVFGWQTQRHVDRATNEMHFEFVKRFDHVTADDMTQRAWAQGMDVRKFRATERQLNIRRLDFLQHVSNDVKVMVREIVHPVDATVFRTNYLTFKIPSPAGYLVGMHSINPPQQQAEPEPATPPTDQDQERVVWIDVSVSVELVACGPNACEVCWRGRTNYKSPQYAAESAVRFLMGVLRWEYVVIGPQLQLF